MAKRVPLTIDTEEVLHQAIQLRAARENQVPDELLSAILRKAFAAEIEEIGGMLPLAAVIQEHHDRQLREEARAPASPRIEPEEGV
jgi:hypothetical protein